MESITKIMKPKIRLTFIFNISTFVVTNHKTTTDTATFYTELSNPKCCRA